MQANTQKLSFVFTFLFFAALLFSVYTVYHLPTQLMQQSTVVDLMVLDQLRPVFIKIYLVLGVSGMLGMITVALLISSRSVAGAQVSVRQVEQIQEEQQQTQNDEEESQLLIDQNQIENTIKDSDDLKTCFDSALSQICKELEASQAAAYRTKQEGDKRWIELFSAYAFHVPEGESVTYRFGEGLAGQVAKEGNIVNINSIPEGYIRILSGLGSASPKHLIILPLREGEQIVGVVEIASFHPFSQSIEVELQQAFDKLALKLVNDHIVSLEKAKR